MTKIIAVTNQKGGVGKTTTSVNLASSLSYLGKRVLLVDTDSQGNATLCLGIDRSSFKNGIYELFSQQAHIEDTIVTCKSVNVDIVPSKPTIESVEYTLINNDNRDFVLYNEIKRIEEKYDYILIDCPPSLGIITKSALVAANSVLIPVQCEFLALDGLTQLLNTIRVIQKIKKANRETLTIDGVLLTMLDTRTKIGYEVINEVKMYFQEKVFKTIIPRNINCSNAASYGLPVTEFSPRSKGSISYKRLAKELLTLDG